MAVSAQLLQVLSDLESADLKIIASELLPALAAEAVSLIPAADQEIAQAVVSGAMPGLQAGLASLIAKIPGA